MDHIVFSTAQNEMYRRQPDSRNTRDTYAKLINILSIVRQVPLQEEE